ncbi:MAG: hypothetical protein V1834_02185, partial [Candidatus Micrarchaeota archaeon]
GGTTTVDVRTGSSSVNQSTECSEDNRVIYSARFQAVVNYSYVFPECKSRNVTIYYDTDFDGVADSMSNLTVGGNLPSAGEEYVEVDSLNTTYNGVDNALQRLLDLLNFVNDPGDTGPSGGPGNPIDVQVGDEVSIEVLTGEQVPYFWGPTEMTIAVWT